MSDIFDGQKHLADMRNEISQFENDELKYYHQSKGWLVPFFVNNCAAELKYHWLQFLKELDQLRNPRGIRAALRWKKPRRNYNDRYKLESDRAFRFKLLLQILQEKYNIAQRTLSIIKKIENGTTGFVLLLREFDFKVGYMNSGSFGTISTKWYEERKKITEYAKAIAPLPLLWVANPSESGHSDTDPLMGTSDKNLGYRIQLDDNWENDVTNLIRNSSFIIVLNDEMTPGVIKEIELTVQLNRICDTFFLSPEKAQHLLNNSPCNQIDDQTFDRIRSCTFARKLLMNSLPPPTCLWLSDEQRDHAEAEVEDLLKAIELAIKRKLPVHYDIQLDSYASLLANYLVLEQTDRLITVIENIVDIFTTVSEHFIQDRKKFATFYWNYGKMFFEAAKNVKSADSVVNFNIEFFSRCREIAKKMQENEGGIVSKDGHFAAGKQADNITSDDEKIASTMNANQVSPAFKRLLLELERQMAVEDKILLCENVLSSENLTRFEAGMVHGILGTGYLERVRRSKKNIVSQFVMHSKQRISEVELLKESIRHYTVAIELNPGNFMDHWNRGYAFELIGDKRKALEDYTKTISYQPEFAKGFLCRGRILEEIGEKQQALSDYEQARQLDPKVPKVAAILKRFFRRWTK